MTPAELHAAAESCEVGVGLVLLLWLAGYLEYRRICGRDGRKERIR